jgi:hypothetical protein
MSEVAFSHADDVGRGPKMAVTEPLIILLCDTCREPVLEGQNPR